MADKGTQLLLEVLKQALTDAGEHRLFRSAKLDGLFASQTAANKDAADLMLRDGLLEIVRTETKGKTTTQWVRSTPKAVDFVHQHESPLQTLQDLKLLLQTTKDGLPQWLDDLRQRLVQQSDELTREVQKWSQRLESLHTQVSEALQKATVMPKRLGVNDSDSEWARELLDYLGRRKSTGMEGECSLPELFNALQLSHKEMSISGFHDQLMRLQDRRTLRLLPFSGDVSTIPEPEFALPDGTQLLYYVAEEAG
ncbi:hypothetical protein BH10PLA2_BH10PLA2_29930 [soil metagenome]